ncbi:MAG: hypothetical protein H7Z37_04150 [Pyrinomonadaceae bacterium]|nr:hypothetical protein [Pyrinomonadaceae bacterium]
MVSKHRFSSIDADYHQFHLQDSKAANGSLGDAWTPEAQSCEVAVAPLIVGVGTRRNTSVWLDLEIHDEKPESRLSKNWKRIVECSLELPSGKLIVTSPTLPETESHRVVLTSYCYRLRIHFGRLSERGTHRYKISMWQNAFLPIEIIKSSDDCE